MNTIEEINKIIYGFVNSIDDTRFEDFALTKSFKDIILEDNTNLIQTQNNIYTPIEKSVSHSYKFLRTIDEKFADKLVQNINDNTMKFYYRDKDDNETAYIQVLDEKTKTIVIPFNNTIDDTYAITHEQLHDMNLEPANLNVTCSLFTEMISFLGELLQRDYFQYQVNTPKEYRNGMKDSFYATRCFAVAMDMELHLIKQMLDKGFINRKDIIDVFRNRSYEDIQYLNYELEAMVNTKELGFYTNQSYIVSNVLACYLHELILLNPKNIGQMKELNQMINEYDIDQIFDYLGFDVRKHDHYDLHEEDKKVLKRVYNKELKRL